jgi:hypothetical protein
MDAFTGLELAIPDSRFPKGSAPILAQKRATLLCCRSVMTVDLREGRVASVAEYCLRSTLLPNFERTISISNSKLQIQEFEIESISEN